MGRSTIPTYVVHYRDQQGLAIVAWNTKTNGRPTESNLERWRKAMNASMKIGGVNEHISRSLGYIPHVSHAEIHNQRTGAVVCAVMMPMFEAVD